MSAARSFSNILVTGGAGYPDRYAFVKGDIRERALVERFFTQYGIDAVVHFAAESHVDRSILDPEAFITTNVLGTYTLLEVARQAWKGRYGEGVGPQSGTAAQSAGTLPIASGLPTSAPVPTAPGFLQTTTIANFLHNPVHPASSCHPVKELSRSSSPNPEL